MKMNMSLSNMGGSHKTPPPPHQDVHILISDTGECQFTRQRGIQATDGTKVAYQLTLR